MTLRKQISDMLGNAGYSDVEAEHERLRKVSGENALRRLNMVYVVTAVKGGTMYRKPDAATMAKRRAAGKRAKAARKVTRARS